MLKKNVLFFGILGLFCLMFSCKKESPTVPIPPKPSTVQSITVSSSSDLLHIGCYSGGVHRKCHYRRLWNGQHFC